MLNGIAQDILQKALVTVYMRRTFRPLRFVEIADIQEQRAAFKNFISCSEYLSITTAYIIKLIINML